MSNYEIAIQALNYCGLFLYMVLTIVGYWLCYIWPSRLFTKRYGFWAGHALYYKGATPWQIIGGIVLMPLLCAPAVVLVYAWWRGDARRLRAQMLKDLAAYYSRVNNAEAAGLMYIEARALMES